MQDIRSETVELVCEMFVRNGKIESAASFLDPLLKDQVGKEGVSTMHGVLAAIALEKGQPTKRITKLEAAQRWLIFFLKKRGISTTSQHFDAIDDLYYEKYHKEEAPAEEDTKEGAPKEEGAQAETADATQSEAAAEEPASATAAA